MQSSMLHGSQTWPVRKENQVALHRREMRMVRWMCNGIRGGGSRPKGRPKRTWRERLCKRIAKHVVWSGRMIWIVVDGRSWSGASTSYSIHFFTQSVTSFCSTCSYHCNLFCCSINIISSIPSLSLNSLLGTLSFSLTLHDYTRVRLAVCHQQ